MNTHCISSIVVSHAADNDFNILNSSATWEIADNPIC